MRIQHIVRKKPITLTGLILIMGTVGWTLKTIATDYTPKASALVENAPAYNGCPSLGWTESLVMYLGTNAAFPVEEPNADCTFHQWSWEAFVWATANVNGAPRFLSLQTPADLVSSAKIKSKGLRKLVLSTRANRAHNSITPEGAGAIIEADGNMLVAPNGYPIYASVHMDPSYFATAKANMMYNGNYSKPSQQNDYFKVGSSVFKATWLRYDQPSEVPAGAYTTVADVPVLQVDPTTKKVTTTGKTKQVNVALLGLHVVGQTKGHPEFLWATFEHELNSPRTPDNTFSTSGSSSQNYTLYKANTSYSQVNIANQGPPATLTFNPETQKFSPVTNVVLQNATGGETFSPEGPQNIAAVNAAGKSFMGSTPMPPGSPKPNSIFGHYDLIGTVWMHNGTYTTANPNWKNINQTNAVGSVSLANSTAETFQQTTALPANGTPQNNCFSCHNPVPFSADPVPTPSGIQPRLIALSHVLGEGTSYAVPNQITVQKICKDVNAGPLFNQGQAETTCPTVCSKAQYQWNGQWTTLSTGTSVCGCCSN